MKPGVYNQNPVNECNRDVTTTIGTARHRLPDEASRVYLIASMGSLFGPVLALFAAFWLFMAARGTVRELKRADRFKWIVGVMYFLILIGASGFFAAALSAVGILKLPTSREWPAGYGEWCRYSAG